VVQPVTPENWSTMLIIAGHVTMDPDQRDEYVATFADMVERSRAAPGCLDVAITADSVEAGRVNVFERWASKEDVEAWRAVADAPDVDVDLEDHVRLFDATNERDPFDL